MKLAQMLMYGPKLEKGPQKRHSKHIAGQYEFHEPRVCTRCDELKFAEEFRICTRPSGNTFRRTYCRTCESKRMTERRLQHKKTALLQESVK